MAFVPLTPVEATCCICAPGFNSEDPAMCVPGPIVIKEREGARDRRMVERERERRERDPCVSFVPTFQTPRILPWAPWALPNQKFACLKMITVGTLILVELQNLMDLWVVRLGEVGEEPSVGQGQGPM